MWGVYIYIDVCLIIFMLGVIMKVKNILERMFDDVFVEDDKLI